MYKKRKPPKISDAIIKVLVIIGILFSPLILFVLSPSFREKVIDVIAAIFEAVLIADISLLFLLTASVIIGLILLVVYLFVRIK